jgi:hypothetical protein
VSLVLALLLFAKASAPPALHLVGHASGRGNSSARVTIHVEAYTSDEDAARVAEAGRDGNANSIRKALGKLDSGFIKIETDGYRVAYARRVVEEGGSRIHLLIRNELDGAGRSSLREEVAPPMAAVDVWLPDGGNAEATIAPSARIAFQGPDQIRITDLSYRPWRSADLVAP